jgi:ketosteroid isomerase-like protein/microcystin-dependent protein
MIVIKSNKALFALLILFCAYCGTNAQNHSNPDIRGKIIKMSRTDSEAQSSKLLGSILVERDRNGISNHDKADVKITKETRIFAQADKDNRTPLKIDALELNQRVEVRFTSDPALLTYPIQVGAAEIIILSGSTQNSGNSLSNAAPQYSNPEMTRLRRAIDAGNAIWAVAWEKGDAVMLPGTFTTDGKELVAGGKIYKGRNQILALMCASMQKRGGKAKLTVTTKDIWLDGNTAYETGTAVYEFTVDRQLQTLERRYFTIWKRLSMRGAWKIYSNTGVAKE